MCWYLSRLMRHCFLGWCKLICYKKQGFFIYPQKTLVTQIEIHSSVICYYQSGMKLKKIVLKVTEPHQMVADLIKKWKGTTCITQKKKFLKVSKTYKINCLYCSRSWKICDLISKELASEIVQYFGIDIHSASVQRILIKFSIEIIYGVAN